MLFPIVPFADRMLVLIVAFLLMRKTIPIGLQSTRMSQYDRTLTLHPGKRRYRITFLPLLTARFAAYYSLRSVPAP